MMELVDVARGWIPFLPSVPTAPPRRRLGIALSRGFGKETTISSRKILLRSPATLTAKNVSTLSRDELETKGHSQNC